MRTVPLADVSELIDYGVTASANSEPIGPKFLRVTDIKMALLIGRPSPIAKQRNASLLQAASEAGTSYLPAREQPRAKVSRSGIVRKRLYSRPTSSGCGQMQRSTRLFSRIFSRLPITGTRYRFRQREQPSQVSMLQSWKSFEFHFHV